MSERQRGILERGEGGGFPLSGLSVTFDASATALVEDSVRRGEGLLTAAGALATDTGVYTGRSPSDKFIVRNEASADVAWGGINQPMEQRHFDLLLRDMHRHARGLELHVQHLHAGADARYRLPVRVVTEYAWHALFARNLFREPEDRRAPDPRVAARDARRPVASDAPWRGWTVVDLPSFRADPDRHGTRSSTVIAVDFRERLVLIGNTEYAGEIKKSVFSVLNLDLPLRGVFPMHCSANEPLDGLGGVALFFGLSGTGKTTLSSDSSRRLIGDDEHGWSDDGVFNFEGGCYAKVIHLSPEKEPEIFAASHRFGTVLENVVVDPETRQVDFASDAKTENTRAAYPIEFVPNASESGVGSHPADVVFLTADAFGVLPPISRLTPEQAMYHFLSGYTAKVAGTERGVTEPTATFSTCFGEPFMPLPPVTYARMLGERLTSHGARAWLVNTGWTGGPYGVGRRMSLPATRALVRAALAGRLDDVPLRADPFFGLAYPTAAPGVPAEVLSPREAWSDPDAYDETARRLVAMFRENFRRSFDGVAGDLAGAGPS
ncbi:MAG TPA: phosphoenolpyruvate carboxykinase (ATP) [Trueperaceae bacterium]